MDSEKKKQLMVKIGCLIAACALWLYVSNVENPIITARIPNVPVELKNIDKLSYHKKVLAEDKDYYVSLDIRGTRSVVRQIKNDDFKVVADLDGYSLKVGKNKIITEVVDYPDEISLLENSLLVIELRVDELIEKSIQVDLNTSGKPKDGFYAHSPVIKPVSVRISGAARYVNSVDKVLAEVNLKDASEDIKQSVALVAIDKAEINLKDVKIEPSIVEVFIPIERTKEVPIEVVTNGTLKEDLALESALPNIEKVQIIGEQDVVEAINSIKTESIDLTKIEGSGPVDVKLIVPKDIKIVGDTQNIRVNFVIDKYIERQLTSYVVVENLSPEYEANPQYETVNLKIRGLKDVINSLDYKLIKCSVNLKGLEEGQHIVPIDIQHPNEISIEYIDVNPIKVEIKKTEETETGNEEINKENENEQNSGEQKSDEENEPANKEASNKEIVNKKTQDEEEKGTNFKNTYDENKF